MHHTTLAVLFWALIFTGQSTAQDIEMTSPTAPKPEVSQQLESAGSILDLKAKEESKPAEKAEPSEETPANEDKAGPEKDTSTVESEATPEEDEASADEDENKDLGPAVVSVNEQGELVGRASAIVHGDEVPIEANITLVSGGVLLGKTVADEDGSFSFPNISPGDYNIYGCAASYCGGRACTVVTDRDRFERVQVQLDQSSDCRCTGYANAPASSLGGSDFGGGSFSSSGFSGGGSSFGGGGGGGATAVGGGGGGGGLLGRRGFRLLAVGGVATAIALGTSDSDEVSPSE